MIRILDMIKLWLWQDLYSKLGKLVIQQLAFILQIGRCSPEKSYSWMVFHITVLRRNINSVGDDIEYIQDFVPVFPAVGIDKLRLLVQVKSTLGIKLNDLFYVNLKNFMIEGDLS